ncbi:MAG: ATP-binding protein [Acidimicrobiales bacterium]
MDARFCNLCATPLAAQAGRRRVERKVVSVLFADLVSHTAASEGLDPEEVWNTLETYHGLARAVLSRHGGTVEKFIGDAVMAVFGAPVVREDDPQRAVRAALELRDKVVAMARRQRTSTMAVRVGVNTGEVVVALDSDSAAGQGIVFGDIVNTAAKLQQAAPVNAVVAGESTVRATEQAITYRPLEPVRAAGRAAPLPVWEALRAREVDGPGWPAFATPFVGRRAERDHLIELVHGACTERSPQLVNVLGVPGIGKSRLVAEALAAVDIGTETLSIRTGHSLPLGPGAGFGAVAEIVKSWAGIRAPDTARAAKDKLRGALSDAGIGGDELSWMARHLRPLVGLATNADTVPDRHVESFAAWRRLFEVLAQRHPTVLVFEDLHWADDALLDFIEHVVEWSADVPLVVVGTARPELLERRPKFGHGIGATSLTLEPLPPIESAELIAALFGDQQVSGAVTDAVLAGSVGNPLFAVEWVRMLRDRASTPESLRTPDTVEAIVAARLDTLAPEDKELLQDASVVGRSFAAGAVAAIAELPVEEVDERLRGLELRQFIQGDGGSVDPDEARYAFAHTLVRDATYAQIPRARRSGKHRLAAEWVASLSPDRAPDRADLLAHHYVTALDLARAAGSATAMLEMRSRIALKESGDAAHALGAFATAARRYQAAIELWPATGDDGERGEMLLRWGECVQIVDGSGAEILTHARDVLLAAGRREPAARAEVLLGDLARTRGDTPSAWRHIEHAAALVDELPPSPTTAYVIANLARARGQASRGTEAIAIAERARAMADAAGDELLGHYAASIVGLERVSAGDLGGFRRSRPSDRRRVDRAAVARRVQDLRQLRHGGCGRR